MFVAHTIVRKKDIYKQEQCFEKNIRLKFYNNILAKYSKLIFRANI